jgi:uncharacterized sporulation protein YeaH/YhbH (DUF444 family)
MQTQQIQELRELFANLQDSLEMVASKANQFEKSLAAIEAEEQSGIADDDRLNDLLDRFESRYGDLIYDDADIDYTIDWRKNYGKECQITVDCEVENSSTMVREIAEKFFQFMREEGGRV